MKTLRRHPVIRAAAALTAALTLVGCGFRSGAPESDSGWRTKVDQTLGSAVSSLGTTALVLESQQRGRLTRAFVVVAVRDSLKTLETETTKFVALQPPPDKERANREAVTALGTARAVLNAASTAASTGSRSERARALREVRKTYTAVSDLSDKLAGSG
jgi:hypothetical protein